MIIIVFAFLLGDIVDLNQHQLHVMLLEAAKLQEAPEDFLGNMYVRICEEMYHKCYFLLQLYTNQSAGVVTLLLKKSVLTQYNTHVSQNSSQKNSLSTIRSTSRNLTQTFIIIPHL